MTAPHADLRARFGSVRLTDHARLRTRDRFPGLKPARIVDEVRAALAAGRVSATSPSSQGHWTCLYTWTADMERVHAVKALEDGWLVTTVLYGDELDEAARTAIVVAVDQTTTKGTP